MTLRIFISSVQKELELERAAVAGLISTDPFQVQQTGFVTSGWCRKQFGVTYDTANRDLLALMKAGLLRRLGNGRATRFELGPESP